MRHLISAVPCFSRLLEGPYFLTAEATGSSFHGLHFAMLAAMFLAVPQQPLKDVCNEIIRGRLPPPFATSMCATTAWRPARISPTINSSITRSQ